jgi:uncharacterized protein (DUF362 family)
LWKIAVAASGTAILPLCAASVEGPSALAVAPAARVVIAHEREATDAFTPRPTVISNMVARAMIQLMGKSNIATAWRAVVNTQDVVGIKVYCQPGANSGTRPAVAAAVVEGLLAAGIPAKQIILWDKHRGDLRRAGFFEFADHYGIRVEGSVEAGYDEKIFYDTPFVQHLVWGDFEFGSSGEGVGRKSYVSKVVSKMTRIISIAPLLNHNTAGVCGHLVSVAMGSVDNTFRFEGDPARMAEAVAEIYALEAIGDRVALSITDALICQYQGEQRALLHYSTVLNELRFSRDPVALDVLSVRELERQRAAAGMPGPKSNRALYENAELLELGVADFEKIGIERVR